MKRRSSFAFSIVAAAAARVTKLSLALALPIAVAAGSAFAGQGDTILRFGAAYVNPTGDFSKVQLDEPPVLGVGVFAADSATGGFVGIEYMVSDQVGIDATILRSNHDFTDSYTETTDGVVTYTNFSSGKASIVPFLLSANFHFVRNDTVDVYAGPTVGFVTYGDVYGRPMKSDFTYGAVLGIDVPFGESNWMLSGAIRYIKTNAETDGAAPDDYLNIVVDPVITQVGLGFRF